MALRFPCRGLKTQTQRSIALIFLVGSIDVVWRDMSRNQFLRSHVSPCIDVDAMTIGDTKEALGLAHHRTDALLPGVDQTDAGYKWLVGARYPVNGIGMLGLKQPFLETTIAGRSLARNRS